MRSTVTALLLLAACTAVPGPVRVGADRILEEPYHSWIRNRRIGLITNQTGVTGGLVPLASLIRNRPELHLAALFGPEHGVYGAEEAGEKIPDGPNIYSLYGDSRAPTHEMLADVDILVYDIQDVGARFYTFISTMYEAMKVAARERLPFVVLDRPNPISGNRVGGPVLENGHESFVGAYPIPIRYGMTVGELARFLNGEAQLGLDLRVVPMENWRRSSWYDQTGLEWIAPSPNMPTLKTATVYPGFCLIEGTNLSEGRGTTRPFELLGAPWLNATELCRQLNTRELPGVAFRQQNFKPAFSKYSGQFCQGIQIHVLNRESFLPVRTVLYVLTEISRIQPNRLEFREAAFDRLVGNSWIRGMLVEGQEPELIESRWEEALELFEENRNGYLLYD